MQPATAVFFCQTTAFTNRSDNERGPIENEHAIIGILPLYRLGESAECRIWDNVLIVTLTVFIRWLRCSLSLRSATVRSSFRYSTTVVGQKVGRSRFPPALNMHVSLVYIYTRLAVSPDISGRGKPLFWPYNTGWPYMYIVYFSGTCVIWVMAGVHLEKNSAVITHNSAVNVVAVPDYTLLRRDRLRRKGCRISHFLLIFAWALQHCSANALPVILCCYFRSRRLCGVSEQFLSYFHCFGLFWPLDIISAFRPFAISCTPKYKLLLLLLLLLLYASMFVHTAPIYADVFTICYHSLQLSCGRNNAKMARVNYEICTVLRYRCFRCYFEYTSYTNICVRIQILRIFRSHLPVKLLHTAPTSADVFLIFAFSYCEKICRFG